LEELNHEQKLAVEHVEGPALVLAGAGSGKTRVVTFRITHLLSLGVPASAIVAVTFTNKAAQEMRSRVEKLAKASILTCTFHSLCARILRESIDVLGYERNFTIYDEEDSEKLLKECLGELKLDKDLFKTLRHEISQAKNNLTPIKEPLFDLYQQKLKAYKALDFDDLLYLTVKLFREHPEVLKKYQARWSFILIDEYQDTNPAQHMLIKLLGAEHNNIFAVGDPDQSIYSWRGATVSNILEFDREFPGARIIRLEQNYRSKSTILNAANALISHNTGRLEKNLWSDLGIGEKITLTTCDTERQEADFVVRKLQTVGVPLSECVIFYRTNFQSRVFEDALIRSRIPYVIVGGLSFYARKEVKDLLAFLRVASSSADFLSFSRTINLPKRGIGDTTIDKLRDESYSRQMPIFEFCHEVCEGKIPFKLSPKQMDGLKSYVDVISSLKSMATTGASISSLISEAIDRTRIIDSLKEDPISYFERRENLSELVSTAAEWESLHPEPSLTAFLEELSLKSSSEKGDPETNSVRMMTLHNGKGLEFKVVFLVGLEEDLLPHINSKEKPEAVEEERRLCYVGMTRAKELLFLTTCRTRFLWGGSRYMRPSRFLAEIPPEYLLKPQTSSEETSESFQPGDTVYHRDFGTGIIQKAYPTSLGETYDILFTESQTLRSLVAKYARLRRRESN
jgi:DNA helicase-2/ATP-dependent DNA helicase PcrA